MNGNIPGSYKLSMLFLTGDKENKMFKKKLMLFQKLSSMICP